jgi:hypothetical protein
MTAQTVSGEFVSLVRTAERCRAQGNTRDTAIGYAAGHHRVSIRVAESLIEQREISELERLAVLAESQNLSALLRRQGE